MVGRPSAWSEVVVEGETILAPGAAAAKILGAPASWISSVNVAPVRGRLYDMRVLSRRFVEYREGIVERRVAKSKVENDEVGRARLLKLELENERLALSNAERRGELVQIDALEPVFTRALATFAARLNAIPGKLTARFGLDSEVELGCSRFIADALRELSDIDPRDGDGSSGENSARLVAGHTTAAEPDPDPMG